MTLKESIVICFLFEPFAVKLNPLRSLTGKAFNKPFAFRPNLVMSNAENNEIRKGY